jgi:hypothetical protein
VRPSPVDRPIAPARDLRYDSRSENLGGAIAARKEPGRTMTRTTTTTTATLAVAADYADALMTARRAKNWLFLLLALILLAQLAAFFLVKFNIFHLNDTVAVSSSNTSVSQPSASDAAASQPAGASTVTTSKFANTRVGDILRYVIPVLDFLGVILSITLSIVLLLLAGIMLVGRLIGVSHVTSAFIWSVVLALMLFPWQAFLISGGNYYVTPGTSAADSSITWDAPEQPAFKIPGVLYTYPELRQDTQRMSQSLKTPEAVVKWARYAAFPIVALLLLLLVQGGSARGLKFALGEAEMHVEVGARPTDPVV